MGEEITLANENGTWETLSTSKWQRRKPYTPTNIKEIKAAIPGRIVKIFSAAKEGCEVKKGEALLELEAMKMINTIVAPISGKISSIAVGEGQDVGKNALLISFE